MAAALSLPGILKTVRSARFKAKRKRFLSPYYSVLMPVKPVAPLPTGILKTVKSVRFKVKGKKDIQPHSYSVLTPLQYLH